MRSLSFFIAAALLTFLAACGGGSSPTNQAPVAAFTVDPAVTTPGETVSLDASTSADPEGDSLDYVWTLDAPEGSSAQLASAGEITNSFIPDVAGTYRVTLVVNEQNGSLNATASRDVEVMLGNRAPVAAFTVTPTVAAPNETVSLDASTSADPDGDSLDYVWTLNVPEGSSAQLASAGEITNSFTPDIVGTYSVTLVVSEQAGDLSATASQDVEAVLGNRAPIANFSISPNEDAVVDVLIALDASASTDPDGDALSYTWTLSDAPEGSQAQLSSIDALTSSFVPDLAGDYQVTLTVSEADGNLSSDISQTINVSAPNNLAYALNQKLLPQNAAIGDGFGRSVALDGDTAVVGAPNVSNPGGDLDRDGVVYVFVRRGEQWQQQAVLTAAGTRESLFGATVALSGDTLVVGAPTGNSQAGVTGVIFVFARQNGVWSAAQRLVGSQSQPPSRFGSSVTVDGDTLVVGAPGLNVDETTAAGAVYVFEKSGAAWQERERFVLSSPAAFDQFGTSLALDNDTFVAGAPNVVTDPEDGTPSKGTAHVYARTTSGWSLQTTLQLSDSGDNHRFGRLVALEGATLAAAAPGTGRVYVYTQSGSDWTLQADVVPSSSEVPGSAVSLAGNTLAIGSLTENRVYLFERQGEQWLERQQLTLGSATNSFFGISVALYDDTLVIGASLDNEAATSAGAAYLYAERLLPVDASRLAR